VCSIHSNTIVITPKEVCSVEKNHKRLLGWVQFCHCDVGFDVKDEVLFVSKAFFICGFVSLVLYDVAALKSTLRLHRAFQNRVFQHFYEYDCLHFYCLLMDSCVVIDQRLYLLKPRLFLTLQLKAKETMKCR
jgi:hypothetical protein